MKKEWFEPRHPRQPRRQEAVMKSLILRGWEATAYAAGTLTQLRRVCKFDPKIVHASYPNGTFETARIFSDRDYSGRVICPYGAPGDKLALREAWNLVPIGGDEWFFEYKAGGASTVFKKDLDGFWDRLGQKKWNSPATMPLWAVRWHPVIQSVRLERVQDVTDDDIVSCGIQCTPPKSWRYVADYRAPYSKQFTRDNPRTPWESNPWCWVLDINNDNYPVHGRGDKA